MSWQVRRCTTSGEDVGATGEWKRWSNEGRRAGGGIGGACLTLDVLMTAKLTKLICSNELMSVLTVCVSGEIII